MVSLRMAGWHGWLFRAGRVRIRMRIAGGLDRIALASMKGRCCLHGIDDLLIAGTSAKIAFNGTCDFIPCRVVIFIEECLRGHEEAWRAKAALRASVSRKTGLNRCKMSAIRKTLNGDDVRTLNLTRQGEAGEFRYAIDHHGTTSTGSKVTTSFDPECSNLVSKYVQEDGVAWCKHFHGLPVDVG